MMPSLRAVGEAISEEIALSNLFGWRQSIQRQSKIFFRQPEKQIYYKEKQ